MLHEASTFNIDKRVRECARVISQETVYHGKCLVALYNKAERSKQSTINGNGKRIQGIALAQLVAYNNNNNNNNLFKVGYTGSGRPFSRAIGSW